MISALALFGNNTFFHTAANTTEEDRSKAAKDICQSGRIPFSVYAHDYDNGQKILGQCNEYTIRKFDQDDETDGDDLMSYLVGGFMQTMELLEDAQRDLDITMFFANEALLSGTAEMGSVWESRFIYSAPGYQVLKPQKTLAGIIAISILIVLQALGLLLLLRFIYSVPTWTGHFDADAMVQIGGQLREQDQKLNIAGASGLVGVVDRHATPNSVDEEEVSDAGQTIRRGDQDYLVVEEGTQKTGIP